MDDNKTIAVEGEIVEETKTERALTPYNDPIVLEPACLDRITSLQDLVSLWLQSRELDQRNQWFKGEIAEKVVSKYGEESLAEFAKEVGEKYINVVMYRRVVRAFPNEDTRMFPLSWTHYLTASMADNWNRSEKKFESDHREEWIEKAADNQWSVGQMREAMRIDNSIREQNDNGYMYLLGKITQFGNMINHWDISKFDASQKETLFNNIEDTLKELKEKLI